MRHVKDLAARLLGFISRLLVRAVVALERFHGGSLLPPPPAYAFVQDDLIQNLPAYLGVRASDIRRIVIVGAWHGEEVGEMLERFPSCRFLLLEPSRGAFTQLSRQFGTNSRVQCLQVAAAGTDGSTLFHETNLAGNGSLLPLAQLGETTFLVPGVKEIDAYTVKTVRLDSLPELQDGEPIDCLWVDVQGFELPVLQGATGVLGCVQVAFIEVATDRRSYEGATSFVDLNPWMSRHSFRLASLGTDPVNGQGNAMWLKDLRSVSTD